VSCDRPSDPRSDLEPLAGDRPSDPRSDLEPLAGDRPSDPRSDLEPLAGHCITCSDEGLPMRVLRLDDDRGLALCADAEGAHHTVETALLPPLAPGDEVLVHAGVALAAL